MPMKPATFRMHDRPKRAQHTTSADRPGGEWLHSRRWRACRLQHLNQHPLCVACEQAGRMTPATEVDHIIAHKGNYDLFWDEANWRSMCKPCHSRKTVLEDGGFREG